MQHWLLLLIILLWGASLFFCRRDYQAGRERKSLPAWIFFIGGWIVQFAFLYMQGMNEGRCPIRTLPEIITFLSWGLAAVYLLLNLVYRSNALAWYAIFTTTLIQMVALFLPQSSPVMVQWLHSCWLAFHASLSVMAYAAFCLSSVLAVMYLLKNRQLKDRDLTERTMTFPAVTNLELWMSRMVLVGFIFFSGGLLSGFFWFENLPAAQRHYDFKICWAATVWLVYFLLLLAHHFHWLRQRIMAWLILLITALTLLSFWSINSISTYHHF